MQLNLTNVESIKKAELTFNKGEFVCIVGQTNSGKTAIFRGLEDLLLNLKEAKDDINQQALKENSSAKMEIELIDDDGNTFIYNRTTSASTYKVNGIDYAKLGRSNVFEVSNIHPKGFLYDPTDIRRVVNMHLEDYKLFPFDRSDSDMFKLLEKIFNFSKTKDVLRATQLDEDDLKFRVTEHRTNIEKNSNILNNSLDIINKINLDIIRESRNKAIDLNNIINNLDNDITVCNTADIYINKVNTTNINNLDFTDLSTSKDIVQDLNFVISIANYISKFNSINNNFDSNIEDYYRVFNEDFYLAQKLDFEITQSNSIISNIENQISSLESTLSKIDKCPLCLQPAKFS